MNQLTRILLLFAVAGGLGSLAAASDRWETLRAINWVENPTNHTRYGSKGELGPYQFRSQTWRLHTSRPFTQAIRRDVADEIAVKHYEWIRRGLMNAGIDPNPYNIAMAWNSGLTAVTTGRVPSSTYRYAEQVRNLVDKQKHDARQWAAAAVRVPAPAPAPVPVAFSLATAVPPVRFGQPGTDEPRFVFTPPEVAPIPVIVVEKSVSSAPVERPLVFMAAVTGPRFSIFN